MGPEIELWEALLRLLVAAGLAGVIGLERELREQEAGLRTHMLVGVGACLFVLGGNYGWSELQFGNREGIVLDPSRVTAYVVTGIGFLGGGAIIRHGINVRGLTTAASLWVVAAIGTASAVGLYELAALTSAIVLASLWPLRQLAAMVGVRSKGAQRLSVELEPGGRVADVIGAVEEAGVVVESAKLAEEDDARMLELVLSGRRQEYAPLLDVVGAVRGVRNAAWAQ
ncbi:MAG: MgtC/SapB family protein [Thermoleophilia bacterium]|nr:MgtC/SapB family protein [Thermoleophilia bacterium]